MQSKLVVQAVVEEDFITNTYTKTATITTATVTAAAIWGVIFGNLTIFSFLTIPTKKSRTLTKKRMFYKFLVVLIYYGLLFVAYQRGLLDTHIPEVPPPPPPPPEPEPEPIDPGKKIDDDGGTGDGTEIPQDLTEKYSSLCMLRSCAPVSFSESFYVVFTQDQLNQMKGIMKTGTDDLMTVTYNKTTRFVVNENFVFRHDMKEVVEKMLAYAHSVAFPPPPPPPPSEVPEVPIDGDNEETPVIPDPIEEPGEEIPEPDPTADKRIVFRLQHNIGTDWNYIVFMKVHGDYDETSNPQLLNRNESVGIKYYFPQSYTNVCQSCVPTGWSETDKCVCK